MTLRKFNNLLTIVVVLLGIYIAGSPFLPELTWRLKKWRDHSGGIPYSGQLAKESGKSGSEPIPSDNRIVIPKINLNEPVKEGGNVWVIHDGGTWHRPNSVNPPDNGNSVIVGHRFYGSKASTFYHLDKLALGDKIGVYWQGKEYVYKVSDIKVVPPTEVSVEAPSSERKLTLYTCTPLWTAKERLVITALPEGVQP